MATDGDTNVADNGLISHSIVSVSPDFRSSFEINEQTGRLTLLDSLDYEVVSYIHLIFIDKNCFLSSYNFLLLI